MKKYPVAFLTIFLFACNNSNNTSGTSGDTAQESSSATNDDDKPMASATGCSAFFWFKKGVVMEYGMSDGTGKHTDTTSTTIDDVHQDGAALIADYTTSLGRGKTVKASYRCEGDKMYMDMKSMFSNFATSRAGMEIEVTDAYISFPWNMKEGDNLDDAKFAIVSKQNGKEFMKMTSTVKERKVESRDKITTPAGSWDCLKITETRTTATEMSGKQISSKDTKSVQWFAPQAGLVKFELYDDAGNMLSRTQLLSLKTD